MGSIIGGLSGVQYARKTPHVCGRKVENHRGKVAGTTQEKEASISRYDGEEFQLVSVLLVSQE